MNLAQHAEPTSLERFFAKRQVRAHVIGAGVAVPTAESTAAELFEQTGFPAGAVAPIGFLRQPLVVVDESLLHFEQLVAGRGKERLLIQISSSDIVVLNDAHTADICKDHQ